MKNEKGSSLFEFLIVLAILSVIAAITIPALREAGNVSRFRAYFGVGLGGTKLTDVQRRELTPLIRLRLAELCAPIAGEPSTDPAQVQKRLELIATRDRNCANATNVAAGMGLPVN